MSYNASRQYRCTIIRGKSKKEMDDLLPAYAKVIDEICPCSQNDFETLFNDAFMKYVPESQRIKKTLDNHRTEIAGKLFGMYYYASDKNVYESERTSKYLDDNDQPAFFKDICYKMQFPNGSQKISTTVVERTSANINIRPNAFIMKLLMIAKERDIYLSRREVGYYVLNSLDVLQMKATPEEVLDTIVDDRNSGTHRDICYPGKASSYCWQHINEQLNYLELANLIRISDGNTIYLNMSEIDTIQLFADDWDKRPAFNVYAYNLDTLNGRESLQLDWDCYYAKLSDYAGLFRTSVEALMDTATTPSDSTKKPKHDNYVEMGDEGETIVYNIEKNRVYAFNPRLVNKVIAMGKIKGIGYDIQSVVAEPGDMSEFVQYIEVKSTKRLTCPDINDDLWIDTLNVTRNEWIAAQQHGAYYSIFRVYFTRDGVKIFVISNVANKITDGSISAVPISYRFDFGKHAVNKVINAD
jgi:hypothetical protein